jgi:hypothetical protein
MMLHKLLPIIPGLSYQVQQSDIQSHENQLKIDPKSLDNSNAVNTQNAQNAQTI